MATVKVEVPQSQVDAATKKEIADLKKALEKANKKIYALTEELDSVRTIGNRLEQVKGHVTDLAYLLDIGPEL